MARDVFRVLVIGATGRGDYGHGLDVVWQGLPDCKVVGVVDADELGRAAAAQRLQVEASYASVEEGLERAKPDIAVIAPRWIDRHRDWIIAALDRGVHVYTEKPLCRSPREADEIIEACRGGKAKLALAHTTRYSPRLSMVRRLIEDGVIGDLLEIRSRGKEDARGGAEDLWVLGSHVLNLMPVFAGEPQWCMARVMTKGRAIQSEDLAPGNEGIGLMAGDQVDASFGFASGVIGYFGSRREAAGGRFALTLYGSKGVIEMQTGHLPQVWLLEDPAWSPGRSGRVWRAVTSAGIEQAEPWEDRPDLGNRLACLDLIEAIREDRQPECSAWEGRVTIEMITAVFRSALQTELVRWPMSDRRAVGEA